MANEIGKGGQIAVFVIVGIMIVAAILFIFLIDRSPTIIRDQDFDNPESYMDNCVKEKAKIVIDEITSHAGFPDSIDTVLYKGIAVPYLCKNINYYQPCVSQHPRYVYEIQNELALQLQDDIEQCFASLEQELSKRNYLIDAGALTISADIKPDIAHVIVERQFTLTKGESIRSYDRFDFFINTKLYELASVAQEIVSQEAKYCYFSNDGFMALYNDFDIMKDVLGESTKIYTITHKTNGEKLTMAIRGCAIPLGF